MLIENFSTILSEEIQGATVVTKIGINADHLLFKGHFPENPITPGVVLIQLFKEQAERFTGERLQVTNASKIKFLAPVDPRIETEVLLESTISNVDESVKLTGKAVHQKVISLKLNLTFKVLSKNEI